MARMRKNSLTRRLSRGLALMAAAGGVAGMAAAEPIAVDAKRSPRDREWQRFATRTVAQADGFTPRKAPAQLDRYGGDPSRPAEARGFFCTRKVGERWWLVDPEGNLFVHVAVCSVAPTTVSDKAREAFDRKFGSGEQWADVAAALIRTNGFNGTGSWSKDALLRGASNRPAYCPNWSFMRAYGKKRGGTYQQSGHTGYPRDAIFVFDPDFETFAMAHARQLAATKDDPWLLGHFSDNELPLQRKSLDNYLSLPTEDHGYRAAREWLQKRHGDKADPGKIADEDREAFREFVVERYFAIVSRAIRTYDPNHLYLGSRFFGDEKRSEGVFRAAGRHADVISVNLYGAWTPNAQRLADWVKWSGKPFMITEFYAKGVDSGMPNTTGAGWLVKTQRDRGLFYQNFCLGLLQSGGCVGWHYFKYQDNDQDNPNTDPSNQDSNKGIVTAYFDEYTEYLKLMSELNWNVYDLIGWMDKGGKP